MTLHPSREWGGEGALGCVLGYGALHRLPAPLSEPVDAPGETMFDGGDLNEKAPYSVGLPVADAGAGFVTPANQFQTGGDFLVPAQMANAPPPAAGSAPPKSHKKKDRHAQRGQANAMDDYFNEQEQKSRELDRPETTRTKSPVAPPPKAGGPPKGGPPKAADTPEEAEVEAEGSPDAEGSADAAA